MLTQHPDVRQCAVVGRAVPGNDEVVVPGEIVILPALPASATGKVLKSALREQAQKRAAT